MMKNETWQTVIQRLSRKQPLDSDTQLQYYDNKWPFLQDNPGEPASKWQLFRIFMRSQRNTVAWLLSCVILQVY